MVYMGLTVHGFPNASFTYTVGGRVILTNIPTVIDMQVDIIVDMITKLGKESARSIEADAGAEEAWMRILDIPVHGSLLKYTAGWSNKGVK
ncbi:hypothetical protein B0A55_08426 [Friedmanniomyces simplex]|uniref:Uncharacterized protein n=1 Tax=Friedmanniomyces simplex TaxID=329884 RepID=A0A4U0WY43_9PEZI|nr:hypothetical protein B0A55_08426 [Friedmanniomyces simplex]